MTAFATKLMTLTAGLALLACSPSATEVAFTSAPAGQPGGADIRHLAPAPDSSGDLPARFEWTPVKGADRYAISLWNDIDVLQWRDNELKTTSVDRPAELRLDSGTYYWAIAALQGDRLIGQSGRAAFVVLR